jgi:hypothetical protein
MNNLEDSSGDTFGNIGLDINFNTCEDTFGNIGLDINFNTCENTFGNLGLNVDFNTCDVITINEFRDLHQSINSCKEFLSMSHSSTQQPQEVSAAISGNSSLLPSRLSTLVGYVHYLIKNLAWSPEEMKLFYPDWYTGIARNIAEEALSISIDISLRDESENISLLNGDPKDIKVSTANNHSILMPHTHRHTLLNETTLSLLGMYQTQPCPLEILLKALEMLDILFQLKLDPSIWLSDSFTLAQICEAKGENDEAETFYRQAINSFTEIDHLFDDEPLKVHHRFGKFLMKINRDEEALLTLLNGYASWLSRIYPVGTESIYFDAWQKSHSDESLEIMQSLQALHVKMDHDGTFARVRASVSQLQNLHGVIAHDVIAHDEKLLIQFMKLGAVYSEMWMLDAASLVFRFAAPRLEPFDGRPHAFARACAYRDYAQHCGRRGSSAGQSTQLQLAFRSIEIAHQYRASYTAEVFHIPESLDELSSMLDNSPGTFQVGQPAEPGPEESYFEFLARQDPELSR